MSSSSQPPPSGQAQDETVRISEVIEKQNELEDQAAEVLPFDITKCSKPAGQIRQSVYSCLTCNPIKPERDHIRAGVCSSCSVSCHTDHQLVELFVRRNFACDCGTDRCNPGRCHLINQPSDSVNQSLQSNPSTSATGPSNRYDKNFDGQFCICERGKTYDPETETEDMYQCLACEDWRHASCLGPHPDPDDWDDLICAHCVQNNPTIKSIMFKHAGGEGTGMIVCKDSGTDGSNRITCYGKLPESNTDAKPEPPSNQTDASTRPVKDSVEESTQMEETGQKKDEDSEVMSCVGASSNSPIPSNHESKKSQEVLPTKDECKALSTEEGDRADEKQTSAEQKNVMSNKKRSSSANPNDQESACRKKPKLDNVSDPSNDPAMIECRAPFKSPAESILTTIDPGFSNVFLTAGWRTRWCPCPDCRQVLGQLSWLVEEEEDVWEPGEDTDSLKSIHELGLEALKNLPRDQLVTGLNAYNKLKEHILEFLKPFESQDLLVTEQDIRQFFNETKSKIHNQTW
ncbi:hypothetical protein PGT21_009607 [Puccinia graminis f. sp. tritici]|uniref:UBR-type domain-containing protein n=1 Tax=Puccinia graminis f. sp. tritici TaxID=56615 RepID=A0A5B0Q5L5_PUCGR|nr:hypothetical protein PGT21_009607 [Puccinia graminis f. sp. tritici]